MVFKFVKKINTKKNSIFYSFIKYNNEILGFGREHYSMEHKKIIKIKINDNFEIIEECTDKLIGEDPRVFIFNKELYIQDNMLSDMKLINYENNNYIDIDIKGKNISFFEHKNELYFIHYIKPLHIYKFNINDKKISKIDVDDDKNDYKYEYRGGTPGYKLDNNTYFGYGHRTYKVDKILKHDIFKWVLYFEENKLPRISHYNIEQPSKSKNICDPTSVLIIDNKKYLITAESDFSWFREQDYITNVYEIVE